MGGVSLFGGLEEEADGDWIYPASTDESDRSPFQALSAPCSIWFSSTCLTMEAHCLYLHALFNFF